MTLRRNSTQRLVCRRRRRRRHDLGDSKSTLAALETAMFVTPIPIEKVPSSIHATPSSSQLPCITGGLLLCPHIAHPQYIKTLLLASSPLFSVPAFSCMFVILVHHYS